LFSYWIETSAVAPSIYSSALTSNSQTYFRLCGIPNYYYEAIQVTVKETGNYTFMSNSTMDTYGYIYTNNFDPFNQKENLLSRDDESGCNGQFKIVARLQVKTTYVLVVTTYHPSVTGTFSVFVSNPNNVNLNQNSEYLYYIVNNQYRSTRYSNCLSTQFSLSIHKKV
jgi:hypothetical protein